MISALPEGTSAEKGLAALKAFVSADPLNELIELLGKIAFHKPADFGKNENLHKLPILTAIKAGPCASGLHHPPGRLRWDEDRHGGSQRAYCLHGEASLIYKMCGLSRQALQTPLTGLDSRERAREFAERAGEVAVRSRSGRTPRSATRSSYPTSSWPASGPRTSLVDRELVYA